MEAGGINAADLAVLADAPRFGRAENYLADLKRILVKDLSRAEKAGASYLVFDAARYPDATTFPSIHSLVDPIVTTCGGNRITNILFVSRFGQKRTVGCANANA